MNLKFRLPPRCAMLSTDPVTKLSIAITLCPRASSRSVKCEPRNPAAPVTTEVFCGCEDRLVPFGICRKYPEAQLSASYKSRTPLGICVMQQPGQLSHQPI